MSSGCGRPGLFTGLNKPTRKALRLVWAGTLFYSWGSSSGSTSHAITVPAPIVPADKHRLINAMNTARRRGMSPDVADLKTLEYTVGKTAMISEVPNAYNVRSDHAGPSALMLGLARWDANPSTTQRAKNNSDLLLISSSGSGWPVASWLMVLFLNSSRDMIDHRVYVSV